MAVGCYHGTISLWLLRASPRTDIGTHVSFPSNIGSRSHAGWPSLGSGPKAMLNFGTSISRCCSS